MPPSYRSRPGATGAPLATPPHLRSGLDDRTARRVGEVGCSSRPTWPSPSSRRPAAPRPGGGGAVRVRAGARGDPARRRFERTTRIDADGRCRSNRNRPAPAISGPGGGASPSAPTTGYRERGGSGRFGCGGVPFVRMCGRFVSASPPDELARYFDVEQVAEQVLDPSYNVAPTTTSTSSSRPAACAASTRSTGG